MVRMQRMARNIDGRCNKMREIDVNELAETMTLHEMYGFGKDRCSKALNDVDGETDHPSASTGKGDAVNSPSHYNMGGIECIDGIKAALGENYIGFLIGNVIKYCWRYKYKNGLEDIKKARYYLEKAIGELENNDGK